MSFSHEVDNLPVSFSRLPPTRVKVLTQLTQYSERYGDLTVPAGFVCDGASIPRPARWYHDPFDPRTLRAAICHDVRCTAWPLEGESWHIGTWKDAHEAFAEGCWDGGLRGFRFEVVTQAVLRFGPRWPDSRVIPVSEAAEFLKRYPFNWRADA